MDHSVYSISSDDTQTSSGDFYSEISETESDNSIQSSETSSVRSVQCTTSESNSGSGSNSVLLDLLVLKQIMEAPTHGDYLNTLEVLTNTIKFLVKVPEHLVTDEHQEMLDKACQFLTGLAGSLDPQ